MKNRLHVLTFIFMAIGLLIRLPRLTTPPLDFHPARQYQTALVARALYRKHLPELPSWKREVALIAVSGGGPETLLPEYLAAMVYRLAGSEQLWLPRLVSVMSWIFGAACLFVVARKLFSKTCALIALTFFLFVPYGIRASRSFQADPLMTAFLIASLAALLWYDRRPSLLRLLSAIIPCAIATFAKPVAIFFLGPVFFALSLQRVRRRGLWKEWRLPFWLGLTLLPTALFYFFSPQSSEELRQASGNSFIFSLLFNPAYWRGWLRMLGRVVGEGFLIAGLAGLLLVRSRPASTVLRGLWLGYLVFGLAFNYHIHTHDYYSLPLIPVVSLSLAGLIHIIINRAGNRMRPALICSAAAGIIFSAALCIAWRRQATPPARILRETAASYERLGWKLSHSTRLVVLDGDYGYPVFYHGELAGQAWPRSFDIKKREQLMGRREPSVASRFAQFVGASYFIATNILELNAQPELVDYLQSRFPRVPFSGIDPIGRQPMVVYDLRESTFKPDRQDLHFGALADGSAMTSPQPLRLLGGFRSSWTALSSNPRFTVSPESGMGSALLCVAIDASKPSSRIGETQGLIRIRRADGGYAGDIHVSLVVAANKSDPPFGSLDLPAVTADPLSGEIFFSGWSLDDVEVKRIRLYRDPPEEKQSGEPIFIADIPLVEGTRPDVERIYSNFPWNRRAGWGYRLLPESVPRESGPVTFRVMAEDAEGNQACLGVRTISWRK